MKGLLLASKFASVMSSVGGILLAVVILLAMVTIHEFGHYVAGKLLGFKITEFSVGFGPALFKKRSKKTGELFALRVVPLGGYCAFAGEDEYEDEGEETEKPSEAAEEPFVEAVTPVEEAETEQAETPKEEEYPEPQGVDFNDQPPWKRIIVLIAGATMNYLLALVLLVVMFTAVGRPQYEVAATMADLQETVAATTAVTTVSDGEELKKGDRISEINGKTVFLVTDYIDALEGKKTGEKVKIKLLRDTDGDGKKEEITLRFALQADGKFKGMSDGSKVCQMLGVGALSMTPTKHGFFDSLGNAFVYSWKLGGMVLRSFGELLTGGLKVTDMGGPVTTITVTAQAAASGAFSFLNTAGLIGVNLAVFNLLPIPALDGSKVIFCIIEWIRKKPINRKVETWIHFAGIIALFGFAILVDLLHLFV